MVAMRSGASSAPVASSSRSDHATLLAHRPTRVRGAFGRLRALLVHGFFGECAAHRKKGLPLSHSGMMFVALEYLTFSYASVSGAFPAPNNLSICGYMELLPDWVLFLYCHVAAAGIDATLWNAVAFARHEPAPVIGVARMLLSLASALCLLGFSVIPRCLWAWHQGCVLWWVNVASGAMALACLRDRKRPGFSYAPCVLWAVGVFSCNYFYYGSSMQFYVAEATGVTAYIAWCSNAHRTYERNGYGMKRILVLDGVAGAAILAAFRYNQRVNCVVTGEWR